MSDTTTSRSPYPDCQFTNPICLALFRNIKIRPIATKLENKARNIIRKKYSCIITQYPSSNSSLPQPLYTACAVRFLNALAVGPPPRAPEAPKAGVEGAGLASVDHGSNRAVRFAPRTVRNPHGSVRPTNRTTTPRFGSWGARTATVRQTAAVRVGNKPPRFAKPPRFVWETNRHGSSNRHRS